jgi:hypothetical protein
MTVLLHEYAHHFLISNSGFPDPRWVGEGAAEFFSSVKFNDGRRIEHRHANAIRYAELAYAKNVTVSSWSTRRCMQTAGQGP